MKFRIISGKYKGRILYTRDSGKSFRPTMERIRESVSEIIKPCLVNAKIADFCSGSGAFGFELLSRGASSVDFVEKNRIRHDSLKKNAEILGITERCNFYCQDITKFVKHSKDNYDIIFYDPPYKHCELQGLILNISFLLSSNGILIYEHSMEYNREDINSDNGIELYDVRSYGNTTIDFYKRID